MKWRVTVPVFHLPSSGFFWLGVHVRTDNDLCFHKTFQHRLRGMMQLDDE